MEAQIKLAGGKTVVKVEGRTQKELFRAIASAQDVFEADTICGCCNSANIRYSARTVEENDYYDLTCRDCSASLSFGQHKSGDTLFPKRKSADGAILPNRGWKKWEPQQRSDGLTSGPRAVRQ